MKESFLSSIEPQDTVTKFCPACRVRKSWKDFGLRKSSNVYTNRNLEAYCRPCRLSKLKEYSRKRYDEFRRFGGQFDRRSFTDNVKKCPNCFQVLPLDSFGKRKERNNQPMAYCRDCHREVSRGGWARKSLEEKNLIMKKQKDKKIKKKVEAIRNEP